MTQLKVLQESEDHFRNLAESMPQLVWTANDEGVVDYYNHRVVEYGGARQSSNGAWEWTPLVHPDDLARTAEAWAASVREHRVYSCEHRVRMADGTYRWHLSRAFPARDNLGHVRRWYGTATDIHTIKETEVALADALRSRDEFLSIASHELKTPLTSLKIQAQMKRRLLDRSPEAAIAPEKFREFLDRIESQVDRTIHLLDDMLDLARINEGRLQINPEPFDLTQCTREVLHRHAPFLDASGCALSTEIEPQIWIHADRVRVEQVITNLVTNAAKYGRGKPVHVSLRKSPSDAVFEVVDRGVGIAPEDQKRIFERFERAANDTNAHGHGLGLYIVRNIVERHGGEISLRSEPGKGSTFTVRLPLPARAQATPIS